MTSKKQKDWMHMFVYIYIYAFWIKVLWSDKTKINLFGYNAAVKHGGGSIMLWCCLAVSGTD